MLILYFFPTAAGFEPTRAKPSGFQVHLLNHSDKLSKKVKLSRGIEPRTLRLLGACSTTEP